MRITGQEQDVRKHRIIHAAYELFCEKGIDTVSMELIANTSGVSSNSVFRYFGTKAQLLQCTQLILWEEIVNQILLNRKEQLQHARSGFEEIKILLLNFQDLYEQHGNYLVFACDYKLYLVRHQIKMPQQIHNEIMKPIIIVFTTALEKGRLDGSISAKESTEEQFSVMWGVMRGFVEQIVIYDRMYEGDNPWKGQFNLVVNYILEALGIRSQANICTKKEGELL